MICRRGRLHKVLLSVAVSIFTSACLYSLPFLASCTPCDPSLPDSVCPTTGRTGNFKQFNCPAGYYNDLASLLHSTNDDAVRNIFSTSTPTEFRGGSLFLFFALYCILGIFTFGIATPSGLFLPIILMGSGYGRLLGLVMSRYTSIDQGLYAVLGAASLMAGSMRMTVSLCVIFLELTNNLLLFPIMMIVLLISKTVGTFSTLASIRAGLQQQQHVGSRTDLHGLVLRNHIITVLRKKWSLPGKRRIEEWEAHERFTSVNLTVDGKIEKEVDPNTISNFKITGKSELRMAEDRT